MVFDFFVGRGGQYPCAVLKGWTCTLVVDACSGYDAALSLDGRSTAYCLAHARKKFDELVKAGASVVAWLYRIEADPKALTPTKRVSSGKLQNLNGLDNFGRGLAPRKLVQGYETKRRLVSAAARIRQPNANVLSRSKAEEQPGQQQDRSRPTAVGHERHPHRRET